MKGLIRFLEDFIRKMSVWDMAALKFCVGAMGVVLGLFVPRERRRPVLAAAVLVFFATYIPLMTKFVSHLLDRVQDRGLAPLYQESRDMDWDD